MSGSKGKRPSSVTVLAAVEVIFGVMGIISGLLLIIDPSGAGIGFTEDIRDKIPFHTFLPVGLFLFFVYGIGSLLLAYGSITRKQLIFGPISRMKRMFWAWTGAMAMVLVLLIWLSIEDSLIGLDFAATYMTILFGLIIFVLLLLPLR